MNRRAIDAAIDEGGGERADLPTAAGKPALTVHDIVEERRALLQGFRLVGKNQHIVRDLLVRRRDFQRVELIGRGGLDVDRFDIGLPVERFDGEFVHGLRHVSCPSAS
ncbi:hypothetical protein D3C72_2064330 [compost metagenome]